MGPPGWRFCQLWDHPGVASGLSGCSAAVLVDELPAGERLYDAVTAACRPRIAVVNLQHEHYYGHTCATKLELITAVDNWIRFCSHRRRHSAIGMLSPIDHEQTLKLTTEAC